MNASTPLEERLRHLADGLRLGDEDEQALDRIRNFDPTSAPPRAHSRVHHRLLVGAGCVIALLLANLAAAWLSPRYARALADAPILGNASGPVLRAVGLNPGDVVQLDDVAESAGHRLHLRAGYADSLHTILVVDVDGVIPPFNRGKTPWYGLEPLDVTLTDQYGHVYNRTYAATDAALVFEPLVGRASKGTAQLTLSVTTVVEADNPASVVTGEWVMHAALSQHPARHLAVPAAVRRGDTTYTVTSVEVSNILELRWTVSGGAVDRVRALAYGQGTSPGAGAEPLDQEWFLARVYDSAGNPVTFIDSATEYPKTGPAQGQLSMLAPPPGVYSIVFGSPTDGARTTIDLR